MIIKGLKKYFFTFVVPTLYGGGSGGGQNTTVQQRNIPKELLPYYQMMLGSMTKQAFTTADSPKTPPVTIGEIGKSRNYLANPFRPDEDNTSYAKGGQVSHYDGGGVTVNQTLPNLTMDTTNGTAALTDITGVQPWKPYGMDASGQVDVNKYVAPLSALQNQANTSAAYLAPPDTSKAATDLANIAGVGGISTAAQGLNYGQSGLGFGNTAADIGTNATKAGEEYANAATNPNAVAAYMNPFLQQSLQPQLDLARQEADITTQKNNSAAAQAGAYGGSRQAVQKALTDQGLALSEANIIGKGYTDAFNNANQNMQFGANLGMQGAQTGIQGQATGIQGANTGLQGVNTAQAGYGLVNSAAQNLGNLGTQELANQTSIINTQNQMGAQQQALDQQKINNAISINDYQQKYPWEILGGYANALNGVQTGNLSTFTPAANPLSQVGGLAAAGIGAYNAFKAKKGGKVPRPGGIGDLAVYNAMKGGK